MRHLVSCGVAVVSVALVLVGHPLNVDAAEAGPLVLSHEGMLLDADGYPVDAMKYVTFQLYGAASGETAIWWETHQVLPISGYYQVFLGSAAPSYTSGLLTTDIFDRSDLWLGVTVGDTIGADHKAVGTELTPRQRFAAVPFAIRAHVALDAVGDIHPSSVTTGQITATNMVVTTDGVLSLGSGATITGSLGADIVGTDQIANGSITLDDLSADLKTTLQQWCGFTDADGDGVPATTDCDENDVSIGAAADGSCDGDDDLLMDMTAGGSDCDDADPTIGLPSSKNYYSINGTASATSTNSCIYHTYTDCTSYSDSEQISCGTCQYVDGCSGSTPGTCANYPSGTSCGAGMTCDSSGVCAVAVSGTGGTITEVGGYRIHTFTSSGTFTINSDATVEYLVVGGGGAGGAGAYLSNEGGLGGGYLRTTGGGGGAGGFLTGTLELSAGSYAITVGQGGLGNESGSCGGRGGDSKIADLVIAQGGGGGNATYRGCDGGSGGGGGTVRSSLGWSVGGGGHGVSGQGNEGGGGSSSTGGGGGGGADGPASAASGGGGRISDITGVSVIYAVGGDGAPWNQITSGADASNIGSGGDGSGLRKDSTSSRRGGNGSDGIVVIRYLAN